MPTYQYACTACDHRFEAVQSFADDPLTQCPECEGRLRKLFGSVGIVFKGPGFYRTDSRSGANGSGAGGEGGGAKKKSGDGEGKSADAKPADSKPAGGAKELASSSTASTSTASSSTSSSASS